MKGGRRRIWIGFIFAVLVTVLAFVSGGCAANIYTVCPGGGCNYTSIQAAIDNATAGEAGDTIIVRDGTYIENVVVDVANLTLRSENSSAFTTVVAALNSSDVFLVTANSVTIMGFTVRNATSMSGIHLDSVHHCTVSGNNASGNNYGIHLSSSSNNNTLTGNTVMNNSCGILVGSSSNNNLTNNTANSNNKYYGIRLSSSSNNNLTGNIATNNSFEGIWLDYSSNNNTLTGNTVSWNYFGIRLSSSSNNNNLAGNTANSNDAQGIYLSSSSGNTLTGNNASNNTKGIFMEYSSNNNTLTNNTASNNSYGIALYYSSNNNTLAGNTASNNSNRGIELYTSNNNSLTGNIASKNVEGIYLRSYSNHNTLTDNIANSNYFGIDLYDSSNNNTLTNNTVSYNNCGIRLESSSSNNLMGNIANSNNDVGILMWSSSNNTLTDNTANSNTDYGIYLDSSSINSLMDNIASNNKYGIYLSSSSNNTIANNTASSNNYSGIALYPSSNNNTLTGNTANSNNATGFYLRSANNNLIYNNYFDNTINAYDDGINIWNISKTAGINIIGGPNLGGNYWSDYTGEDTDGDGLGDTLLPYNSSGNIANGGDYLPLIKALVIRIGYQPSTHHLAYITAMDKGWWEEDLKIFGIEKVTDHEFPSGLPEMQALMNNEIDIAYVGVAPFISAVDAGLDAKIVAGVQINGSHLVLRPEINYASPADLRGLKIATFPLCSVMDVVLKKWLVNNGLNPDNDLEIMPLGREDAIKAIENGSIDGVFLPHPDPAIIELNGSGRMVIASGEMWPNHACCCLVVSGKLIREYPEMVKQIVNTHMKATEYVINHQYEVAEMYADTTGANITAVNYSFETWDGAWVSDPRIELNSTLEYAKLMFDSGCVNKLLTEDDLFDFRFYKEATIFDTSLGSYPSIMGTHNGTIVPSHNLTVSKLYIYPCMGTGGHAEYVKIWNSTTGWNVTATWTGFKGDWHNLTFNNSFPLFANQTYNYTIRTGSYPQIIHAQSFNATGGIITCSEFVDVNGKRHEGWIPAIRLE